MKIFFANGRRTYPLFNGGDGILMHDYLLALSNLGHKATAIGKINNSDFNENAKTVVKKLVSLGIKLRVIQNKTLEYEHTNNYMCKLYAEDVFLKKLKLDLIKNKPDILLTQLNYSHKIIELASKLKIKVVLFIHDNHPYNFLPLNISSKISYIIFNSKNTSRHFRKYAKCDSSIIYPSPKLAEYKPSRTNRKYITIINPTDEKGGNVLIQIIKNIPDMHFLIVKGWKKLNNEFRKHRNVKIINRQYDMKIVYSQTKTLLVPSQWEEAFARVVPEAMASGIPVIASKVGGLIESVGNAGILIDNFVNSRAWVDTIRDVSGNKKISDKLSALGKLQAKKFDFNNGFSKLLKILDRVYRS